jgi:hypothetical protein
MAAQDDIGSRGEALFVARILNFCGRPLPYFRPRFLGEKARTLDYLVELVVPRHNANDLGLCFLGDPP